MGAQLLLWLGLFITSHLSVMVIMWLCFGMFSSIRTNLGYPYLMELLPKKYQTLVTTIWSIQEALIYVLATTYFWKISKHWFYFVLVGLIYNVSCIFLLYFIPESPRYLVNAGKLEQARKAFEKIAMFNKKELNWDSRRFD